MGIWDFIFKKKKKEPSANRKKKASLISPSKLKGKLVGKITHYFPRPQAAALKLSHKSLKIGDKIYIKGHTTNFIQFVASLQINNEPIKRGGKGRVVGIGVKGKVRKGDKVYLVEDK
ncbi:MAG: translation elongation factor-like protein [Candidatus Omnitrophica bacterium]|nr:translation elongation factor-like protein [Candidatus Omnitrophota bacterium]